MILLLFLYELHCVWHQCNGETLALSTVCRARCGYAHFQIGFGCDFLLALMEKNHRTSVMDLTVDTITGKTVCYTPHSLAHTV